MFERVTPEQVGISSASIKKYISILEKSHLSTHNIIMIRHGKIFYENYWKPFHKDFLHRMYSVSKSFVSIAIGFLWQDGLIDLEEKAVAYLESDVYEGASDEVKSQTIKNMLMMCTGATDYTDCWFPRKPKDRLRDYFETSSLKYEGTRKIPGTIFDYDSPGSFVLGCIVEKISGMTLVEYLREKLFRKIGVSEDAYCLSCPGGHSWGDSAILCKAEDLARVVQFVLQKGEWEGKQLLDRQYLTDAASNLVCTDISGHLCADSCGYGYQIWQTHENSFFFNGMGCQYGIGVPHKDMVFVINSDNQGHPNPQQIIIDRFFEEIVDNASDSPLPENKIAYKDLTDYSEKLSLFAFAGSVSNPVSDEISGKEFIMEENPMGISKMKFTFKNDECRLDYTNAQGDKTLRIGIDKNIFDVFPEEGYSDMVATETAPGNYYKCASSAKWTHERNLCVLTQIIDKYFGRLYMRITFTKNGELSVVMNKFAEDFLDEYHGYAKGTIIN